MAYVASAIRMKSNCNYSYNLLEIDEIYLSNSGWYKKEIIHNYVKDNPGSVKVGTNYGPNVVPAISIYGEKYVKSSPNSTTTDNLLELPRE